MMSEREFSMRILIMRTIAHNKIWEGNERSCHYENQNYQFIKIWEPNITKFNLDQIKYGIGIYTRYYFNYISWHSGIKTSTDTVQETQPSLLNLKSIDGISSSFIEDKSDKIRITFELSKKYEAFDKTKMFELDDKLIKQKIKELGYKPKTRFASLCFSLNYESAKSIFIQFGINII